MIIVLKQDAPQRESPRICTELEGMGLQINRLQGQRHPLLGLIATTKAHRRELGAGKPRG